MENHLLKTIAKYINWIADVIVQPGENELQALAEGTLRVLNGEENPKDYPGLVKYSIDKGGHQFWHMNMI